LLEVDRTSTYQTVSGFGAALTEQNACRVSALVNALLDEFDVNAEASPVAALLHYFTDWLTQYEAQSTHLPEVSPTELLRHLMKANGLKQRDLAIEMGGQPAVSAALRGLRPINLRQARALAARFGISVHAFIESAGLPEPTQGYVVREDITAVEMATLKGHQLQRLSAVAHSSVTEYLQ